MRNHQLGVFILGTALALCCDHGASAQTVQLPSISYFSYSGSVLVPDRGATSLGSVSRSSMGRSSRGFGNRAIGSSFGHAGATAHVTIIDNDAIDRQIRGLPPRGPNAARRPHGLAGVSRPIQSTRLPRPTVAEPDAEGKALVRYARKQYLAGKLTSSFDGYSLAIETLSPKLAELAKAEFHRVFPSKRRPVAR